MAAGMHDWLVTSSEATLTEDASNPFAPKRGEFKAGIANCEGAVEAGRSLHRSRIHESRYRTVPVPQ
jgi:hypothetical protein